MSDSFAVHLGGGAYLDASGNIVFGPPSGAQIYKATAGFQFDDVKKIQEAFKGLSDILPHDEAGKKKWMDWGVPAGMVNFLGKISGAVGIIATSIAVYAWAINALTSLMGLMKDSMTPELQQAFSGIKIQLQGQEEIDRANHMIKLVSPFEGAVKDVNQLLIRLVVEDPVGAARAQIFKDLQTIVGGPGGLAGTPLSELLKQPWTTTYNSDAYKGRAFASMLLVFERSDGSLAPVPMQSPDLTVFDYRLGVPMLLYGVTTFTGLLLIAMPWFRSAGMFAPHLRDGANTIDGFVLRMQDESLSRTEYTPETVLQQQIWPIFQIPTGGGPKGWWDPVQTYAVGAFDLVHYNDAFLGDRWVKQFEAGEDTGPRGLFNYRWHTTATDLEDIAAAANEQARQDYVNLQVTTGMFRLISTAAWLRFLSTPPDRSQTVSGFAVESRVYRDEAPTKAKSPSILGTTIEHPATLKRYEARNRVSITTQEPGYVPQFRYRSVLRTIESLFGETAWDPRGYVGWVWRADYEPTEGDPRCQRLRTELRKHLILSEVVLYDGPSPPQAWTDGKNDVKLRATTFDWYVPVVSPWSSYVDIADFAISPGAPGVGKKLMLGTGGVSIHLLGDQALAQAPMQVMGGPAPLVATVAAEFTELGDLITSGHISLDKAERRNVKITDPEKGEYVKIDWKLSWTAGKLEVTLAGRPEDRPFQVHVVLEETVYSGEPFAAGDALSNPQLVEQIHTPFVAELVNQMVLVPEEFFTKERKTLETGSEMFRTFERKFAEQAPVGPGDPIEFLQKSIRALQTRSSSTATLAATLDMRVEFAMREAPELWNAVLRETQRDTGNS